MFAVFVVTTAGCMGALPGGDDAGGEPLDDVPQGVDVIMYMDSGIVQDEATVETMNGLIDLSKEQNPNYDGPGSYEQALQEAENESDLDIEGFQSMLVFGQANPSGQTEYAGAIIQTDWTVEELQNAGDGGMENLEEDSYNGVDVYVQEDELTGDVTWFADFGDGKFAVGPEGVVQDVIDTNQGDAEPFSGELRNAYQSVEDGYLKAAVTVPEDEFSDQAASGPYQSASDIEIMTMVYYTEGTDMNVDAQLTATNETAAGQLRQDVDDSVSALNLIAGEEPAVQDMIDGITVEQDGSDVVVNFQTNPDQIIALMKTFQEQYQSGGAPVESVDGDRIEVAG